MPLQRNYRFVFKNELGDSLYNGQLTLNARRWKFDSNGTLDFETNETLLFSLNTTVADDGFVATSGVDNTTSGYIGGAFEIWANPTGASTSGNVVCFYETSTDDGTQFDQEADGAVGDNGRIVAILTMNTTGTAVKSFRVT
jgi:hypothetical protein